MSPPTSKWRNRFKDAVRYAEKYELSGKGHLIGGNFLRARRGHSLIGLPGSGKTLLAVHMNICLRTGNAFFNRPVQRSRAILFACEAVDSTLERLRVAAKRADLSWPVEGLRVIPCGPIDRKDENCVSDIIDEIAVQKADVYTIDTLNAAGAGSEDANDMGACQRAITFINNETGAAIFVIHHSPQDGSNRERGHGSYRGMLDLSVFVKTPTLSTALA